MKLWAARDKNGDISVYREEPRLDKLGDFFTGKMFRFGMKLSNDSFPEITFENSPQQVELTLVK